MWLFFFFFFQAEDGIRDFHVTGVQTCALPISAPEGGGAGPGRPADPRPPPAAPGRSSTGAGCPDRKSTRLNSSHVKISYAVFCLKKKNNKNIAVLFKKKKKKKKKKEK